MLRLQLPQIVCVIEGKGFHDTSIPSKVPADEQWI
jgi:hypothetical protein